MVHRWNKKFRPGTRVVVNLPEKVECQTMDAAYTDTYTGKASVHVTTLVGAVPLELVSVREREASE